MEKCTSELQDSDSSVFSEDGAYYRNDRVGDVDYCLSGQCGNTQVVITKEDIG